MKKLLALLFRIGLIEKVVNKNRLFGSANSYYRVIVYEQIDGDLIGRHLLITKTEYERILKWGLKNPEDIVGN